MSRENYLREVKQRLNRIFLSSKEGYKVPSEERHRLEGFMHAGVYMEVVTKKELAKVMEDTHFSIFGKTIQQRRTELSSNLQEETIDYSYYDRPTFVRKN